jgi:hypothetical protein
MIPSIFDMLSILPDEAWSRIEPQLLCTPPNPECVASEHQGDGGTSKNRRRKQSAIESAALCTMQKLETLSPRT